VVVSSLGFGSDLITEMDVAISCKFLTTYREIATMFTLTDTHATSKKFSSSPRAYCWLCDTAFPALNLEATMVNSSRNQISLDPIQSTFPSPGEWSSSLYPQGCRVKLSQTHQNPLEAAVNPGGGMGMLASAAGRSEFSTAAGFQVGYW
jgi:hypothetical protein